MKKFIINTFIFLLGFFLLSLPITWIVDRGLKKSDYSTEYKEWDDITKGRVNADILIMGSSKAWRHISPQALQDSFKISAYNLGMDGTHFRPQKWRFDVYTKYNKLPKYIIQVAGINEFEDPHIDYNFTQYIPYLNEGYMQRFGKNGFLNWMDQYIPLYKYTHSTGIMKAGLMANFKRHDSRNYKDRGFLSLSTHWQDSVFQATVKKFPHGMKAFADTAAYNDFIAYAEFCKREKIDLIIVNVPSYIGFQKLVTNPDYIPGLYKKIAAKYNLKYLDYSQDTICRDTAMFYNFNHLNTRGVGIFNKILIKDLKKEIK